MPEILSQVMMEDNCNMTAFDYYLKNNESKESAGYEILHNEERK